MFRPLLTVLLLGGTMLQLGCNRVLANSPQPDNEKGYRHLMAVLADRPISTCEHLQHDGSTCYRTQGHEECGNTRDHASEAIAMWIEKNVPAGCGDCGHIKWETAKPPRKP